MGEGRNRGGNSRRWIMREVEESLRRLGTDSDRPVSDPPAGPGHRHRGDPLGPDRPGPPGQDPGVRLARPSARRTSWTRTTSPSGAAWAGSAPSSRRTRSWPAGSSRGPAPLPEVRHGCDDVEPARLRFPVRPLPQGRDRRSDGWAGGAVAVAVRPVAAGEPGQARCGGTAGGTGRPGRMHARGTGDGVPAHPSGGHFGAPRPAHHGSVARLAEGRVADAGRRDAGPDRRDRPARRQPLQGARAVGPGAGRPGSAPPCRPPTARPPESGYRWRLGPRGWHRCEPWPTCG